MLGSEAWGEGHVIAGKFRLSRRLGQGGMGSVWAAEHLALHSTVAIKIIDPSIAKNPEALGRFMREAQAAAALRSPHVVQTLDYGVEEGVPFIAMELLEGETLAQRLDTVGHLSAESTARILTQVGRAISRAHEGGIVHRDLKPDNIFLVRNDDDEVAKVLDFGIAKDTGSGLGQSSSQTRTGAILGTPYYMSPEQAEGNRSVDHRTDLWSLGVIAFECVTGRRPFDSEALGELILQICVRPIPAPSSFAPLPPGFDEWFARCTARDLAVRFQSARELTTQLRSVAGLQTAGPATARDAMASQLELPRVTQATAARNAISGDVGALTHTSMNTGRTPRRVIAGATVGALLLAGTIAAFVLRPAGHDTASAAAGPPAAAAVPPAPNPTIATPSPPVRAAVPTIPVVTSAQPAEPTIAPTPPAASSASIPVPAPRTAPHELRSPHPAKAAAHSSSRASPRHHVDFGF